MTEGIHAYADRLAFEVAKVIDGLDAGTKTAKQARRHLAVLGVAA